MSLTPQQIAEIKRRALAKGISEKEVDLAMPQLVKDFDAKMQGSGTVDTAGVKPPTPVAPTVAPTTDSQGNFITNTAKALVKPAVDAAKFVGESVAQASRVGADAISGNQGIFGSDEINKEVGQLALQDRQILAQMKAEKDPEKKKALAQQSRDLNAKIDALGNQAREIGSKQTSFLVDEEKIKDRGSIALTGAKATAGAASYAVPVAKGIKATLALGGAAGGLSGFGSSEDGGVLETAKDTAMGVAGGVAGAAVLPLAGSLLRDGKTVGNRVLNKMLNPFTSQYDDEIVKLATSKGVDLPVSARTKSNTVKQLEAWSQKSFFGGKVTERIIKARDEVDTLAQDLTNKLAKDIDKKSIGEAVKKGFGEFEDSFNKTKTSLYNSVPKSVATTETEASATVKALQEIIEAKEKSAAPNTNVEYYKTILKNITKGKKAEASTTQIFGANGQVLNAPPAYKPTYEILRKTRTTLGEKLKNFSDPIATGDKASLQKVYATLSDDMEQTIKATDENAYKMFETANEFYKQGINKINSNIGKTIKNADPEKLIDTLLKPNSETDIALVKSVVDDEAIRKLQEGFTSKIYNQSLDSKQVLDIKKLRNNLAKYGESSIKELLGDEGYGKFQQTLLDLEDIDKLKQAIQRGSKPADGSQTAFIISQIGTFSLLPFNPSLFMAKIGSDALVTKLFTTESGQKFLTEGLKEIAEKSGVQLSSSAEQIVGRLLALQGSGISGVINQGGEENSSSSSSNTEESPNSNDADNNGNIFPSDETLIQSAQATSPLGVNSTDIVPQAVAPTFIHPDPRFRRYQSKEEMVRDAFDQGYDAETIAILKRDWDENAPTSQSNTLPPQVIALLEQRTLLSKAGVNTRTVDAQLAQFGFDTSSGQTDVEKNYGPAVSRSLEQLEKISGIGTDKTLFTGGSTTIGKAVKGVGVSGRLATDAEFAEKANQYRSSLNLVIGAINQLLGAGVLNDGEAERLISTIPNEYTSEADAKAWFENARVTLNVK